MSQLQCGMLRSVTNRPSIKFAGNVCVGNRIMAQIVLMDNPRPNTERDAPQFYVYETLNGVVTGRHLGAAWLKNSDKVNGGDFLSITLDDPDWQSALNLTAFPPDKGEEWRIVWSRPRAVQAAA